MTLGIVVNIGSGNGLLPDGNKPLPEPTMTKLYHMIWLASIVYDVNVKFNFCVYVDVAFYFKVKYCIYKQWGPGVIYLRLGE